jgi:hypothetical protein
MVLINLHGWDYIISDKKYEELRPTFLSTRGTIWVYVYPDFQKKQRNNNPTQYEISIQTCKNIKKELQEEYEKNFKKIKKIISNTNMKSKLVKNNEKFGIYHFHFNDLEKEDILKLKLLNYTLGKDMDISVYFNYVRRKQK